MNTSILRIKGVVLFCFAIFAIYTIVLCVKFKFTNTAYFGRDDWEYQSMAVNLAFGHGYKFGAIETFEQYRFLRSEGDAGEEGFNLFYNLGKSGGLYNFYRTPGYPVFVGAIYKIFGVNPIIVKYIQLLLIVFVVSFLPLIGYYFWKRYGFISGILSGPLFLYVHSYQLSSEIMTEALILFIVFLILITLILWHRRTTIFSSACLGIILSLGCLIKGSLVFIPVLVILYFIYLILKKRLILFTFLAFLIGFLVIIIPWSNYVYNTIGKRVFLSTQTDNALLDCNNEFSLNGSWHPEGYSGNKDNFYHRENIANLPTTLKLFSFYREYPHFIPSIFINKFNNGFNGFLFFKIGLVVMTYDILLRCIFLFIKKFKKQNCVKFLVMFLVILLFYVILNIKYLKAGHIFIIFITTYVFSFIATKKKLLDIPLTLQIIFINFFLITMVFLGLPRYIDVIDNYFTLICITYLLISTKHSLAGILKGDIYEKVL